MCIPSKPPNDSSEGRMFTLKVATPWANSKSLGTRAAAGEGAPNARVAEESTWSVTNLRNIPELGNGGWVTIGSHQNWALSLSFSDILSLRSWPVKKILMQEPGRLLSWLALA